MTGRHRRNGGRRRSVALAALVLLASLAAIAPIHVFAQSSPADVPVTFHDASEEARFHTLASSLRCVMCQNESLADSNAMIAHDLRREILAMMRQGKTDAQIRSFLVARYGEFVLYQPRVEPATWLLWFGPLVLFVAGGVTVMQVVRHRASRLRKQSTSATSTTEPVADSSEDW